MLLVKVAGAHDTAAHIPGAKLKLFPGMGHDLPGLAGVPLKKRQSGALA